jgi:hypothetical protein
MSSIVVIGGNGFYGKRIVESLTARGHQVRVASRAADVSVDLGNSDTFAPLGHYDIVINASDSLAAPPDALAGWILKEGGVLMDLGADPTTVDRLLALDASDAKGTIIVGVGLFPGLSTILAAEAQSEFDADEITLAIRLSPFSGAGDGTIRLMTEMLKDRIGPAAPVPFGRSEAVAGAHEVRLPDQALIQRATGCSKVVTRLALRPAPLGAMFRGASWMIRTLGPLGRILTLPMTATLFLLRAVILRDRTTAVELTVMAGGVRRVQTFEDGHAATALGVLSTLTAFNSRPEALAPGIYTAADV